MSGTPEQLIPPETEYSPAKTHRNWLKVALDTSAIVLTYGAAALYSADAAAKAVETLSDGEVKASALKAAVFFVAGTVHFVRTQIRK